MKYYLSTLVAVVVMMFFIDVDTNTKLVYLNQGIITEDISSHHYDDFFIIVMDDYLPVLNNIEEFVGGITIPNTSSITIATMEYDIGDKPSRL